MNTKSHIVCLLMVALVACERTKENRKASSSENHRPAIGFPNYDYLPEKLKHTMDHLVRIHPNRSYQFYYYFAANDINQHFYMVDNGLEVVAEMPVTNEDALNLIDEKRYENKTGEGGLTMAWDSAYFSKPHKRETKGIRFTSAVRIISYLFPEGTANFQQLRVAIVEDTTFRGFNRHSDLPDDSLYALSAVDVPPIPMRGIEYFRAAIMKKVQKAEVFVLYDTGTVEIEFSVWGSTAHSPNLVRGFSTREDTHEAYQADGEFIKAVNSAKVRWHSAQKDGKPVASLMRVTFDIGTLKNHSH